jgi:hypothetical protein
LDTDGYFILSMAIKSAHYLQTHTECWQKNKILIYPQFFESWVKLSAPFAPFCYSPRLYSGRRIVGSLIPASTIYGEFFCSIHGAKRTPVGASISNPNQ